jgi:hypothetical protein
VEAGKSPNKEAVLKAYKTSKKEGGKTPSLGNYKKGYMIRLAMTRGAVVTRVIEK